MMLFSKNLKLGGKHSLKRLQTLNFRLRVTPTGKCQAGWMVASSPQDLHNSKWKTLNLAQQVMALDDSTNLTSKTARYLWLQKCLIQSGINFAQTRRILNQIFFSKKLFLLEWDQRSLVWICTMHLNMATTFLSSSLKCQTSKLSLQQQIKPYHLSSIKIHWLSKVCYRGKMKLLVHLV